MKDKVYCFWEKKGTSLPPGNLVTHRDLYQVRIEIDTITSLLNEKDVVLDAGCGNGFSTSVYARKCRKVVGLDYAESMIRSARVRYRARNTEFIRGSVLDLDDRYGTFSAILSTRCLINLGSWANQKKAIRNMHRCLKKNGRLILAEGTSQGRRNLNKMRVAVGLKRMPRVWHNIDIDEKKLMPFIGRLFTVERDIRFGTYDVLTRVYHPKMVFPREPKYGSAFHAAAYDLCSRLKEDPFREYCREFIMVLRKR